MANTVIIGVTSAIAAEVAKILADRKDNLFLVGRDPLKVQAVRKDLEIRGANIKGELKLDLNDWKRHEEILNEARKALGEIDTLLVAHGTFRSQKAGEKDFGVALQEFNDNLISSVSLLTIFGNYFELQNAGTIAVITSVAGDRGRKRNYIYGAAKAGLNVFLQGLRNRLYASQVKVVTIKPGFVDTPMTADLKKGFLFAKPTTVAKGIVRAIDQGKDCVYLPWFWRPILWVIRMIPERFFKRTNF